MSKHEPHNRSGWSFLGFLRSVLRDRSSFWRLFALVLLLIFAYALAKGDVIALYDHLTRHAAGWEKWGIPPGGIGIFFGARKYFIYRQAARAIRATEATAVAKKPKKPKKGKKPKQGKKSKKSKKLPGNRATSGPEKAPDEKHYLVGEPGGSHGEYHGHADPDNDPRLADDI